jgi:hypothetical protein
LTNGASQLGTFNEQYVRGIRQTDQSGTKQAMSFDVFLFPSSASPVGAAYDQRVVAASRMAGAVKPDISGGTSSDGVPFEIFDGGDGVSFALRDISPGLCKVIFQVALQTRSYVAWDGDYAVRIKGAPGRSPNLGMPVRSVATAGDLCVDLTKGYGSWAGYAARVRRQVNPK